MTDDRLLRLIDACCEARENESFWPKPPEIGPTHCNEAVQFVLNRFGYKTLAGLVANDMIDYMSAKTDEWRKVDMFEAQRLANEGCVVVAGKKDAPKGHVVVIRPGKMDFSPKWNSRVPKCLQIGRHVTISTALNWAFQLPPDIYVLIGSCTPQAKSST